MLPAYSRKRAAFLRRNKQDTRPDYNDSGQLLRSIQPAIVISKKGEVSLIIRPTGRRNQIAVVKANYRKRNGDTVQYSMTLPRLRGISRSLLEQMIFAAKTTKTAVDIPGHYWRGEGSDGRKAHWVALPGWDPAKRYGGAGTVWASVYSHLARALRQRNAAKKSNKTQAENRQVANGLARRLGGGMWADVGRRATPFIEFSPAQRKKILTDIVQLAQREAWKAIRPVSN